MAAMPAPVNGHEKDVKLVSQCLDFCQTLAGKSLTFSFSLNIGPSFSFSVDTTGNGALAPKKKKKKPTPSTLRRNTRRREDFLKKKAKTSTEEYSQSEPVSEEEAEASVKAPSGLHHHPSPSPSSERRQVITVGREKARPSFNQLDGDPTSSHPSPPSSPSGASIPTLDHDDEDIPEVVFGEGDGTLVFCKKYSTPPAKVKHPVDGLASFQWSSKIDGSCFYEVKATAALVRVFNPA